MGAVEFVTQVGALCDNLIPTSAPRGVRSAHVLPDEAGSRSPASERRERELGHPPGSSLPRLGVRGPGSLSLFVGRLALAPRAACAASGFRCRGRPGRVRPSYGENGVARVRLTDQAEGVSRQSGPPPGVQLPPDYRWSSWWDTRRGCSLLLCAFGAAALVLSAVTAVTSGWVATASGVLAGLAAFMAMGALLGVVLPTERGWYWGD